MISQVLNSVLVLKIVFGIFGNLQLIKTNFESEKKSLDKFTKNFSNINKPLISME